MLLSRCMPHKHAPLFLLTLGCAGSDADARESTTPADSDVEACPASLTAISPAADAEGVSPIGAIEARYEGPVPEGSGVISLVGSDGPVAGISQWDAASGRATFVPESRLVPGASYTASADLCGATTSWSFAVRTQVGPELEGAAFDLDLATVDWVAPDPVLGSIFLGYLLTDHVLVLVQDVDADGATLDVAGAMGWAPDGAVEQYPCADPLDFPVVSVPENPLFRVGPYSSVLVSDGSPFELQALQLSGTFNGTTRLVDVELSVFIDIGDLYFGDTPLCDVVADYGSACEACPESGQVRCLYLDAVADEALATTVPIDPSLDPSADDDCRIF